jgi:hypothetical protein
VNFPSEEVADQWLKNTLCASSSNNKLNIIVGRKIFVYIFCSFFYVFRHDRDVLDLEKLYSFYLISESVFGCNSKQVYGLCCGKRNFHSSYCDVLKAERFIFWLLDSNHVPGIVLTTCKFHRARISVSRRASSMMQRGGRHANPFLLFAQAHTDFTLLRVENLIKSVRKLSSHSQ